MVVLLNGMALAESFLVKLSLEKFYGIGPKISERLMARHFIHPTAKMGQLRDQQVDDLTADLSEMHIENDLKRTMRANIQRLRDMGTYRGRRHAMQLPVRGQRTRTQITTARKLNRAGQVERKA
ncbi:hypothetical protein MBLNU457_1950t1 [Dothideomycetes sp. NU457]